MPATAQAAESVPAVFRQEVLGAFSVSQWDRDGFYVWPNVMTDPCRERMSASLRRLQDTQDHIIRNTDWNSLDWPAHGLPMRKTPVTRDIIEEWAGGSESTARGFPDGYGRGLSFNLPLRTPDGVQCEGFLVSVFPPSVLGSCTHRQALCSRPGSQYFCAPRWALSMGSEHALKWCSRNTSRWRTTRG